MVSSTPDILRYKRTICILNSMHKPIRNTVQTEQVIDAIIDVVKTFLEISRFLSVEKKDYIGFKELTGFT